MPLVGIKYVIAGLLCQMAVRCLTPDKFGARCEVTNLIRYLRYLSM
jgi:hypothetical protein